MNEQVVIVGPGRVGLALGAALLDAGATARLVYYGRAVEPPPHPLFDQGVEYRMGPRPLPRESTVLLLAVSDDALAEVAHDLAAVGEAPPRCVALHLSGAVATDVLEPLHARGYPVGSMHPLQTVADPWSGAERLRGCAFAIAGEPAAVAAARRLVDALHGRALVIPPGLRPIYHAAGVFGSNFLVALCSAAAELLRQAGVPDEEALPALFPLLRGTLDNLEHLGPAAALTGPIARGDLDTVRLHLLRLSGPMRDLYCALGMEALRLARAAGLDQARADQMEALLQRD